MNAFITIFAALLALGLATQNNIADFNKLCFVACFPDALSSSCPPNTTVSEFQFGTDITKTTRRLIAEVRNKVAGGSILGKDNKNLPRSSQMGYMKLRTNLSNLASIALKQCKPVGDECTDVYERIGQISYTVVLDGTDHTANSNTVVANAIEYWISNCSLVNINDIMAYRGPYSPCLQLTIDRNPAMGCAIRASDADNNQRNYTLLCNFEVPPTFGCPIYTIGNKSCSTNAISRFANLCSVKESYTSSCPNPISCDSAANASCPNGTTHTTCLNYTNTRCPLIDITDNDTASAEQALNSLRVNNVPPYMSPFFDFFPVQNLASVNSPANVVWSKKLEILAAGFAVSCPSSTADCPQTPAYSSFDQEIYCSPDGNISVDQLLADAINNWTSSDSFKQSFVVKARNVKTRVGCAIWVPLNATKCVICNFGIKK